VFLTLLRVGLSPLLVAGASLAGRRWGHGVGGWLAGFPFVAGPILLVVAIEQGVAFAAQAARSALLGMVALVGFAVWFGWMSRYRHWILALVSGWGVYLALAAGLAPLDRGILPNLGIILLALVGGSFGLPRAHLPASAHARIPAHLDIPLRMLATLALVCALTLSASHLGTTWSGLLTPFPVATTVLSVFAHLTGGPQAVARFLKGYLPGLASLAVFFAVLAGSLPLQGIPAFWTALGAAVTTHSLLALGKSRFGL
jgi:hypothetical protein